MNIFVLSSLSAFIASLLISAFIFAKSYKNPKRNTFIIIALMAGVWCLFPAAAALPISASATLFLVKLVYIAAVFTGPAFLTFGLTIAEVEKGGLEKTLVRASYIIGLLFLPVLFSPMMIRDVLRFRPFFALVVGPLYPLFILFFALTCIYSFYRLLIIFSTTTGQRRNQIKYVFIAYFLAFLGAVVHFGSAYGLKEIFPHDILVVSCMFILAYAIIAHRLMEIEIIIRKTLVFAGLLATVLAIFIIPTIVIQEYLVRGVGIGGKLFGMTISVIIIIVSMKRIEGFLINITDRYLFQKQYDYRDLLRTFTTEVLTVVNMDELVNLTVSKLVDIIKLASCAVLLFDEEKQQFNVMASHNIKDPNVTLIRPDGIVTFMEETHGYLLMKDLKQKNISVPVSIQDIIDKLNAELLIPMVMHEEVVGVLSLGKKKSDEEYTQDDLDILLPLARTLAIAISNAKLFAELGKTQAEAAQKEKMAVIGTLSAGINHEICNPLGIARGQCEAFLLNIKDGLYKSKTSEELLTKAEDIMAKVIKETDRATAITKKLSSFAKPAKGESEQVKIDKEVDEVLGLVGYELKLEKIEIIKDVEAGLPDILVDRKQFQEVLFNLIRNAGQAIGEKGKIIIRARHKKDQVIIDIQDTGPGIAEDKVKMLFNPFFTTKDPGKGTGLGLFIVRQVVEKNGGKIYLKETKVGEGTTFTIEFPLTVPAPQEAKAA